MAAGFSMLEAGMVRTKNTTAILTKNICLYSLSCLAFFVCGYFLMYGPMSDGDHAGTSDFFFQVVFVATAASIISGTIAERMKCWPFMVFVAILAGVIYPIQGSWTWGGGFLSEMGFSDFAGSTIVHSVGGWAALAVLHLPLELPPASPPVASLPPASCDRGLDDLAIALCVSTIDKFGG